MRQVEFASSEKDYWLLYDTENGREISCNSAPRFLAFLLSPGTRQAHMKWRNPSNGTAGLVVFGPRADDGEFLNLRYVLSAREVGKFTENETRLMLMRLRQLWGSPSGPNHLLVLFRHVMGLK